MKYKCIGPELKRQFDAEKVLVKQGLPYLRIMPDIYLLREIARRGLVLAISPTNARCMEWKSTLPKTERTHIGRKGGQM